jgi:hypothetical protein
MSIIAMKQMKDVKAAGRETRAEAVSRSPKTSETGFEDEEQGWSGKCMEKRWEMIPCRSAARLNCREALAVPADLRGELR